jgi:hypothetical protein
MKKYFYFDKAFENSYAILRLMQSILLQSIACRKYKGQLCPPRYGWIHPFEFFTTRPNSLSK